MSDKYTLQLKNFRSIRDAEIDIAPLTVVYGPNGSGKSSLIYGLLTLKNFLTEPNQESAGAIFVSGNQPRWTRRSGLQSSEQRYH